MTDYKTQIQQLQNDANQFKRGDHRKTNILEKAVKIADQHNDQQQQYSLRLALVEDAVSSGRIELALTAYGFVLGMIDQYPEKFQFNLSVAWYYKWIIPCMVQMPQFPKERIFSVLDDMEKRYEKSGYTKRVFVYYQYKVAKQMGEFEAAKKYYAAQSDLPYGFLQMDCRACILNHYVSFLCQTDEEEAAWKNAESILSGEDKCAHVPQGTYSSLMLYALQKKDMKKAKEMAALLLPLIELQSGEVGNFTNVMFLRLAEKNYGRVQELFEFFFPHIIHSFEKDHVFDFYMVAAQLFRSLALTSEVVKVKMPDDFPLKHSEDEYATKDLEAWFEKELSNIEQAFNQRNENTYFTDLKNKYEGIYHQYHTLESIQ